MEVEPRPAEVNKIDNPKVRSKIELKPKKRILILQPKRKQKVINFQSPDTSFSV